MHAAHAVDSRGATTFSPRCLLRRRAVVYSVVARTVFLPNTLLAPRHNREETHTVRSTSIRVRVALLPHVLQLDSRMVCLLTGFSVGDHCSVE